MNTLIKNVPIARAGKIIDGREITRSMLKHCVETFNPDSYQPNIGEFINDPMVSVDIQNQGRVERLKLKDDTLFADVEMYMPVVDVKVSGYCIQRTRRLQNASINVRNSC
ncbi:TPA: hypothetical protein ACJGMX_001533 [Salmonella enterica subsp. enterica serovar Virchow]|nr:hypothetical protein [Salmonella enterica]EHL3320905.1 hypothetical protein [Salmonella enterica subsp. enterica serovar Virchow]HBK8341757.1 hypothetical protein [Salmonella enterica subsp. enterica serovar Heidelberg]HDN4477359.1 hypothetical protein [Salmonella enterica subsp. enterica serovar Aberdeen]EHI9788268.1 hypothetical protein [Salmonella enterica]